MREPGMPISRPPLRNLATAGTLLAWLLFATTWGLSDQPQPKTSSPPLKLEQVLDMVAAELNSVDILVEAKSRGLAFIVSADVIKQLQERGADDLLLNWLGLYSVELRPLYASCLSEQQQKRPARVIEVSTELLERSPRLLPIYFIRGGAYRVQNKLSEAATDFRQALTIHHNSSRARVLLAETLIAQHETDDAITQLNWVLEHRSAAGIQDWPTAHRLLAEAYLQRREYQLASRELHTALWQLPFPNAESVTLLPDLEDHMSVLARLLALCPDPTVASPADAIEIANLMKKLATNKEQQQVALLRLAEGQAAAGQFDEAVVTQKAAEIISTGVSTESIHERLAQYQKKQLPLLPAGKATADSTTKPMISAFSTATFLDRMKKLGESPSAVSPGAGSAIKPFWIGQYEVTRGEWATVLGLPQPASPELPVDRVSWDDCQAFLKQLNAKSPSGGPQFRLPTDAEWKFAAQAGTSKAFFFGDDAAKLAVYGWYADRGNRAPKKGGQLRENSWGLFDIYGNVAEWCQDEVSLATNSHELKTSIPFRLVAGGSYLSSALQCRADNAGFARQNEARRGLGLRLVADHPEGGNLSVDVPSTATTKPPTPTHRAGLNLAIDSARSTLESEVFQRPWLQEKLFTLLYLQACVRSSMNDVDSAITNLRALIREMPDDNSPLMHLTRCHLAWIQCTRESATPEQIAEARKIVETSLTRSEFKLWIGYLTQSVVLAAAGEYEDAARRATQANDLAPQQFKPICAEQLQAINGKKSAMSREFPISPAMTPATVLGQ